MADENTQLAAPLSTPLDQLKFIRKHMPKVWSMLIRGGCCPNSLDILCRRDPSISCSDCWKKVLDQSPSYPSVLSDGRYYCPFCHSALTFLKVEKNRQRWTCGKCNKDFVVVFSAEELAGTVLPEKDSKNS